MATAKPAGSDVVNPLVADWGDRKASDGGHGAAPERLVFEVGTADAGHSRKSRKSPYQSDVPFFSRRNIISLHTCAFWALFAFCAVTFVLFFIKLIGLETSCPEPWNCASGWSKLRRDDYEYCVPPTICGAGQAYWQGSCQPYTVCSYGNGFPYVSVPGMACDEGLLCMPKPFNRTASECVLDILCKVPPHLVGIKRFNGDACVRSGESCWVKYDMNAKLIASIVGTTLFPIIIIAVNALYLHRQGRLSTFAGEHCSAKVEHSHRSRWCRIVYHLTAMSSYEGYQFAVSLLGCLSFIGYSLNVRVVKEFVTSWDTTAVFYEQTLGPETELAWATVETVVVSAFMWDMLTRLFSAPAGTSHKFVTSFYNLADVAAYSWVVLPFIISSSAINKSGFPYGTYFLAAPFRFLRLRRAVAGLDKARRGRDINFGMLTLRSRTAALLVIVFNVTLYIFISAAITMIFEFPCAILQDPDTCQPAFQKFYLAVYWVICTYSTVGYGDIYPATDWGRMVVMVLIVVMLVQVPIYINKLSEFFEEDSQLDELQATLNSLDRDVRAKLQLPPPAPTKVPSGSAEADSDAVARCMEWAAESIRYHSTEDSLRHLCAAVEVPFTGRQQAAHDLARKLLLGKGTAGNVRNRHHNTGINPVQRAASRGRRVRRQGEEQ